MTQQSTKKEYNSFIQGIITEAGPLTFPENASLDEANFVLNRDGSRQRRLGMDLEDDYVLRNVTLRADDAVASFRWENAANDVNLQFAVVQVGTQLLIFDAKQDAVSANLIATLNISTYSDGKRRIGTASGMGYFFITGGVTTPAYLSYDPATKAVTITAIPIKIRDVFGVNDGLAVNTTPATLTDTHNYNLLNQGWDAGKISAYATAQGSYPSNTQQWFVGKDSNEDFQPAQLAKQDFGTSEAPKGRFIIDAFARSAGRTSQTGLTLDPDTETGYPAAVGFGFGRVWFAGMKSVFNGASEFNPNYTGYVFYSRTIRGAKDFGQMHSDADPTSEHDSELVDTDGGFVNIPESGQIYKLLQKGRSMLVFAEHGIWEITGGEIGFTATAHEVKKLSSFGVLSSSTIIDAEDSVFYFNKGGIYLLSPDETTGFLSAKNISEKTIQTYFNKITNAAKRNAVGAFDPVNRRVMWMYSDDPLYDGVSYRHKYNKELVFDGVVGAFYPHTISSYQSPSPYIAGYLETPDMLVRGDAFRTQENTVTKYLTVQYINEPLNIAAVAYSYYWDTGFRDWRSVDGVGFSYLSYMITGYELMGDSARPKQVPYLVMHFKKTEVTSEELGDEVTANYPSGCVVQAQWDWSDSPDSGKWGEEFQAYRLKRPLLLPGAAGDINYGQAVVTTKTRLRGSGRALSLYIRSEDDKDLHLYGWAARFSGKAFV